ncbi:hypothetical protein [Sphingomonas sp.]|uniref:hypothetical protein n=1 Tax=Sphingomonas sp. TaxID=28214 RepID=UPI0035A8EEF0
MPATPARAAFVSEEYRSAVYQNTGIKTLYGKVARDTLDAPIDTYFDDVSAVQTMVNERGALLEKHARAFRLQIGAPVDIGGVFAINNLLPGATVKSDELLANMSCAVVAIEAYDTGTGQATVAVWGAI